jgi:hypothetical protein
MIAGWSEADSSLDKDPGRYVAPYFSNSTEAARGFRDLGKVCQAFSTKSGDTKLAAWGTRLVDEAKALRKDLDAAIADATRRLDADTLAARVRGSRIRDAVAGQGDAARVARGRQEDRRCGCADALGPGRLHDRSAAEVAYDRCDDRPARYGNRRSVCACARPAPRACNQRRSTDNQRKRMLAAKP